MKNLNKRTKILLGIAGVVIVVLVVGIVILGPDAAGLFGSDVIHISPTNPTISVGQTIDMSINSMFGCNWYSSNYGVAAFVITGGWSGWYGDDEHHYKHVQVIGRAPGQTVIEAQCAMTRRTTVTVK